MKTKIVVDVNTVTRSACEHADNQWQPAHKVTQQPVGRGGARSDAQTGRTSTEVIVLELLRRSCTVTSHLSMRSIWTETRREHVTDTHRETSAPAGCRLVSTATPSQQVLGV